MKLTPLVLALALLAPACGGGASDPAGLNDQASTAMADGDWAAAQTAYAAALAAIGDDTSHAEYKAATLGRIEAMAHASGEKAKAEFQALHESHPDLLVVKDYSYIGSQLVSAGDAASGAYVVDMGLKRFQGDASLMKVMDAIRAKAAAGDSAASSALSGLGYLD